MAAALDEQASDTVQAGPAAPRRRASADVTAAGETTCGSSFGASAAAPAPNARASNRSPPPAARASATTVANDERPDSAPTNTPMRAAGASTAACRQASSAAGASSVQRRSIDVATPGGPSQNRAGTAAATVDGNPVTSNAVTGATALAPSASAARDD